MPKKIFATRGFKHLDANCVPLRTRRADRLPTAALEAAALVHVNGSLTIADLAARLGLSDVEAASVVARLVDVGCVTVDASVPEDHDAEVRPTVPSAARPMPRNRASGTRRCARAAASGRARSS